MTATVQCVCSSCVHIQHWHVGTKANRTGHVLCIPPSSAETDIRHPQRRPHQPIESVCIKARWSLFGHVHRMPRETLADLDIYHYFTPADDAGWRATMSNTPNCPRQRSAGNRQASSKPARSRLAEIARQNSMEELKPECLDSGTSETVPTVAVTRKCDHTYYTQISMEAVAYKDLKTLSNIFSLYVLGLKNIHTQT